MKPISCLGKGLAFWVALSMSLLANAIGGCTAVMLGRLYFMHGGTQTWLYTLLQSGGWPILLPPLAFIHCTASTSSDKSINIHRHHHLISEIPQAPEQIKPPWRLSNVFAGYKARMLVFSCVIGVLVGIDNLLFAWGLSYLPVSTSALLYCTQLPFNVLFAFMLVRQTLSSFVLNAVVIITAGAILLGIQSSSDMPPGTTHRQYMLGFVATIGGTSLYAFLLALIELAYKKLQKQGTAMVMEFQVGTSIFATLFALAGMWATNAFRAVEQEAARFEMGPAAYWQTVVWTAICWQVTTIGLYGIIALTSSLVACAFTTAMLPVIPILGVLFFHDSFSAIKGVSAFLSLWGFLSYIYHGYLLSKTPAPCTNNILIRHHELQQEAQPMSNPDLYLSAPSSPAPAATSLHNVSASTAIL